MRHGHRTLSFRLTLDNDNKAYFNGAYNFAREKFSRKVVKPQEFKRQAYKEY